MRKMAWQQSAWKNGPHSNWKEYSVRGYSSSQQSWQKGYEKTSGQDVRWESKTYKQLCRSYLFDRQEHSKIKNDRRQEQKVEGEYEKWQQKKQYEYDAKKNQHGMEQANREKKAQLCGKSISLHMMVQPR